MVLANGDIEVVTYRFLDFHVLQFKKRNRYRFSFPVVADCETMEERLTPPFVFTSRISDFGGSDSALRVPELLGGNLPLS